MSARARPPELLQAGAGVHDPGSKGGSVDPYVGTISDQIIAIHLVCSSELKDT